MSLMQKLSIILILSANLLAATDQEVEAFLKKGISNNPNISNLRVEINGKKSLTALKNWDAYFVTIEADVKQGSEKRHITQNGTYFISGNILSSELINIKTGERYNDVMAPEFNQSFYTTFNHISGDKNAPYKIAIFSDPLCPFCKKYVPDALNYMMKYPSTFAIYYYHFPLAGLHPASVTLTKAAIAAEQKNIKNVTLKLYKVDIDANEKDDQKILNAFNKTFGTKIELTDIRSAAVQKQFESDQKISKAMMVAGTPTVFFNGVKDSKKMKYKEVKVK